MFLAFYFDVNCAVSLIGKKKSLLELKCVFFCLEVLIT